MRKIADAAGEQAPRSDHQMSADACEDEDPQWAIGDYSFVVAASRLPAPGLFSTTTVGVPGTWRPR